MGAEAGGAGRGAIPVLVVGPHLLINQALCALLSGLPGIEAVGAGQRLAMAESLLSERPPLVLLVCPQPADLEQLAAFHQQHPSLRTICLGLTWTPYDTLSTLRAGTTGCLSLDLTAEELALALRQAAQGEVTLSPDLAQHLIAHLAQQARPLPSPHEVLTRREQDVLTLVCHGLGNKEIAQRLFLSVRTVENHLASIYAKLDVRTRTEAAVLAMQQGWDVPPAEC